MQYGLVRYLLCLKICNNTYEMNYILYKDPIDLNTLAIVRYLHNIEIEGTPKHCIERNHNIIGPLPTIYCISTDKFYYGFDKCVRYYELNTNIKNLYSKSEEFMKENPSYRIN